MLKMSTGRRASVLAIFAIFLREYIDKTNKKVHNKFTNEYGIQEHGFAGYFARSTEKRGANPRRRNGTVRCMFFPTAQVRGHSRERGRLCGKNGAFAPRTKSGYSVPTSAFGFPKGASMQCIKMFAPKFEKTLVLFYCRNRRERTLPFFTP